MGLEKTNPAGSLQPRGQHGLDLPALHFVTAAQKESIVVKKGFLLDLLDPFFVQWFL
jgi:hypothetical protein